MNLQDLASIAEIVGGFAVLATLIYLVIELRDNTRTLKAKATTAALLGWSDWNALLSQHPERSVIARACNPQESIDNFDPEDQVLLDFVGRAMVQRFSASFINTKRAFWLRSHGNSKSPIATAFLHFRFGRHGLRMNMSNPFTLTSFCRRLSQLQL